MREATLVVLPYLRTDASGVLATAIGHGRPVVVSDVGSLGETVREFGLGEVVPPGDEARSPRRAAAARRPRRARAPPSKARAPPAQR